MYKQITSNELWSRNFITILISHFFLFFGFQVLIPTIPIFASSFSTNESFIGLVTGLYTISSVLIRPVSGAFLDKSGRRIVLSISLLAFILSVLSYNMLTGMGAFLALRFIHGLGWGSANTASDTVATDNIPQERIGEGMGYFGLAMILGMMLGPIVGMAIVDNFGFKALFYSSAFLVLLSFLISSTINYEKKESRKKAEKVEEINKEKKDNKSIFTFEKDSLDAAIIMALVTISYGAIVGFFPLYAQQQGVGGIGSFFTIYAGAMMVSRPFLGKVLDKHGFDYVVIPGIILLMISMLLLGLTSSLKSYMFLAILFGLGFGANHLSMQTMAIKRLPQEKRGGANAMFYVGFDGGITLGSILFGYIAARLGYANMYLLTLVPSTLALIYYLNIRKNYRLKQN